jgi:hypothetical protein
MQLYIVILTVQLTFHTKIETKVPSRIKVTVAQFASLLVALGNVSGVLMTQCVSESASVIEVSAPPCFSFLSCLNHRLRLSSFVQLIQIFNINLK